MYKLSPFTYSFHNSEKSKKIFLEESLEFKKNEMIAIVGPSGGGKSTFLKILKGIIPEYSSGTLTGEILFHNKSLAGENFQSNLKNILYLFQNPFSQLIYPTPEEEFLFSMENFNYSREAMNIERQKLEKIFGLEKIWGKKNSQLSNGECQKLVLASLLAINPEVLLLDEPTAFLDPLARKEFYQFLKMIKGERLVIIVDHHIDEIRDLVTDFIEVSKDGKISKGYSTHDTEDLEALSFESASLPKHADLKLSLTNISFGFDKKKPIFSDVNFKAGSGDIIALTGVNGVGKSTLMKLISGIIKSDSGKVLLKSGAKEFSGSKIFNHTGFIFQNPETHFFFDTIEEELKQSFKNISDDSFKKELLQIFFHDIDLKKSPFLLSEGEKRRLSILMSVFLGKELIIYDEPTFGQDRKSIHQIATLIREIKKTGVIQLFISHDNYFINEVADRILILEKGSLNEIS